MSVFTFDVAAFRVSFPAFANTTTFPDATLEMNFNTALFYVQDMLGGDLTFDQRYYAITLMTAHITQLSVLTMNGQNTVLVQTATVDKVSVGLTPPPLQNQWQWWLTTTSYGNALFALLQTNSVGGFYIGGSPQIAAFRQVGGYPFFPFCRGSWPWGR